MDYDLYSIIGKKLQAHDMDGAIALLEERLGAEQCDRFTSLIGTGFSNPSADVLAYINRFISSCESQFPVQSVYLEMNGFFINYDLWFFSPFGYSSYETDPDDLDWLSDWQSDDDFEKMPLTGLETVQADFQWYCTQREKSDKRSEQAYDIATLLVMVRFVALIQTALTSGALVKAIPVLATAHDFDILGRFEPVSVA